VDRRTGLQPFVEAVQGRASSVLARARDVLAEMMNTFQRTQVGGVDAGRLDAARAFPRKAPWRIDFVLSENSLGFHAPQETARILGEAIDFARQGQIVLLSSASR
jgi:nitrite reductase (cytochrome c-552)